MQMGLGIARLLVIAIGCTSAAVDTAKPLWTANGPKVLRTGHDNVVIDPSLRRYTGIVTGLGHPDREGRIYSFQAKPIGPGAIPPAPNEFRGWRLTLLAGKRFASVFEVESNTGSEVTVISRDGPLNGLAVSDVFIVEEIGKDAQSASRAGS